MNSDNLIGRYQRLRTRYAARDTRMGQVLAVRDGRISEIAPDMFAEGSYAQPMVANMIDVAARDTAEMIAPLPAVSCTSPNMVSDRAKKKADVRTMIAQGIVAASDLQTQMFTGADWFITYGFLPLRVEIDDERQMPVLRLLDPMGCYPEYDRFNRVTALFQRVWCEASHIAELYPEHAHLIRQHANTYGTDAPVEVVFFHDKHQDAVLMPAVHDKPLATVRNPMGEVMVRICRRPGPTLRGQYDDVIFVQLAKARLAALNLEATEKSVQAPLVLPPDVTTVPMGADALIRTNSPGNIQRVKLDLPPGAFAAQGSLEQELRLGSRYPEVRTGNADTSVITGKGVQALMGGFDTQIRTIQALMARWLADSISLALRADEKHFGSRDKKLTGSVNGTPFAINYQPKRDIGGDYTVDCQYGLMAGLDPNRWLIFGLQARAEKLVSRDYLRRQMPADLDAGEEERKVDVEDMREALKQAIQGYAQAIPALAQQGQDPMQILAVLGTVIEGRRKGQPIEKLIEEAFTPEPEPEPAAPDPAALPPGEAPPGDAAESGMPGEAGGDPASTMLGRGGLMPGVSFGQQGMAPGGRPDVKMMLAGLTQGGQPNLQANVSRQQAF